MSKATDYRICPALCSVYIAKPSKVNPNLMTDDRREITRDEILGLIDWYTDKELGDKYRRLSFDSAIREGFRVCITYEEKEKKDESK